MTAARHARDGQRRDDLSAWLRDTWVRARKRLRRTARNALWATGDRLCARKLTFPAGHWLGELGWKLSGPFRAIRPPAPDQPVDYWPAYYPAPLVSRRAGRAAGGAPGVAPSTGAPEVPAPACPPGGAGTSPGLSRPGDLPLPRTARSGPGRQLPDAAPGEVTAPIAPGAVTRPPWATWQDPPGAPMRNAYRGAAGRRETIAMPALDAPVRPYLLAHLARQDSAVTL